MLGLNGSISPCHIIQLDLDPLGFEMAFNWAYTYQLFVVENWTNEALEYKKTYTRQIYLLILFLTDMRSQVAVWSNNAPSTSPTCLTLSFGLAHFIGHTTLCYCCPLKMCGESCCERVNGCVRMIGMLCVCMCARVICVMCVLGCKKSYGYLE